jgi:Protein of unknown function (DUF1573)
MKKHILCGAIMVLASFSLVAQQIKFDQQGTIMYGQIEQGSKGDCWVEFTNIGDVPLIITAAGTNSGGCMATYPREPIRPQEKGQIRIMYDTKRIGRFTRYLTVRSNSLIDAELRFQITGEVLPKNIPNPEKQ